MLRSVLTDQARRWLRGMSRLWAQGPVAWDSEPAIAAALWAGLPVHQAQIERTCAYLAASGQTRHPLYSAFAPIVFRIPGVALQCADDMTRLWKIRRCLVASRISLDSPIDPALQAIFDACLKEQSHPDARQRDWRYLDITALPPGLEIAALSPEDQSFFSYHRMFFVDRREGRASKPVVTEIGATQFARRIDIAVETWDSGDLVRADLMDRTFGLIEAHQTDPHANSGCEFTFRTLSRAIEQVRIEASRRLDPQAWPGQPGDDAPDAARAISVLTSWSAPIAPQAADDVSGVQRVGQRGRRRL